MKCSRAFRAFVSRWMLSGFLLLTLLLQSLQPAMACSISNLYSMSTLQPGEDGYILVEGTVFDEGDDNRGQITITLTASGGATFDTSFTTAQYYFGFGGMGSVNVVTNTSTSIVVQVTDHPGDSYQFTYQVDFKALTEGTINVSVNMTVGPDGVLDSPTSGMASTSISVQSAVCGNGITEPGEQCDTSGESASCDADCTYVSCGDSTINTSAGEECEGTEFNGASCSSESGKPDGSLTCNGSCQIETSNCSDCGDGITEGAEQCDDSGESASCDVDCTNVSCGDGTVNSSAGEVCEPSDLQGESCSSQTAGAQPNGTLGCAVGCGSFDTSGCGVCGDGTTNAPEESCDDGNLDDGDGCSSSCQSEGGGGDRRTGNGFSVNEEEEEIFVDEESEDEEEEEDEDDGDDPRDVGEEEEWSCEEACADYLANAAAAAQRIANLQSNIDLYPLNGQGAGLGAPVAAGPGVYTLRSLTARKLAADNFLTEVGVDLEEITSGDRCYSECGEPPCVPCDIDTSVVDALNERVSRLRSQLQYVESLENFPQLREDGQNQAYLRNARKQIEEQLEHWTPIVEEEQAFIDELRQRCQQMAAMYGLSICDSGAESGSGDDGDDPRDVGTPPDVSSCEDCGYLYTTAAIIYSRIYRPFIDEMIQKYSSDTTRMGEVDRKGNFKESAEFTRDKNREKKMRELMNRILKAYRDCVESHGGFNESCPEVEDFTERPNKCRDLCSNVLNEFEDWLQNACSNLDDNERETKKQRKELEKQIRQKSRELSRAQAARERLNNALDQAYNQLGDNAAFHPQVQAAEERSQEMQTGRDTNDDGKYDGEGEYPGIDQLQAELDELQRALDALNEKKSPDDMQDEYDEWMDKIAPCFDCKLKSGIELRDAKARGDVPESISDACPEGSEDGGEEGGEGGDGEGGEGGEGGGQQPGGGGGGTPPQGGGGNQGGGDQGGGEQEGGDQGGDDQDDTGTGQRGGGGAPAPDPNPPPPPPPPAPPLTDAELAAGAGQGTDQDDQEDEEDQDDPDEVDPDQDDQGGEETDPRRTRTRGDGEGSDPEPTDPDAPDDDLRGAAPEGGPTTGGDQGDGTQVDDPDAPGGPTVQDPCAGKTDCLDGLDFAKIRESLNEERTQSLETTTGNFARGRGAGDLQERLGEITSYYQGVDGAAEKFVNDVQSGNLSEYPRFSGEGVFDFFKGAFPDLSDGQVDQLVITLDSHLGDIDDCLKDAFPAECAENRGEGTSTGSGSGTGTQADAPSGPGTQARPVRPQDFGNQLCRATLEAKRSQLQQEREKTILGGGSVTKLDDEIADINSQLEGRGEDPAICQNPKIPCIAGTFARTKFLEERLAGLNELSNLESVLEGHERALQDFKDFQESIGESEFTDANAAAERTSTLQANVDAAQKAVDTKRQELGHSGSTSGAIDAANQSLEAIQSHLAEHCPKESLSCDDLIDYRNHLSSQVGSDSVHQGMLEAEMEGIDSELDGRGCATRTVEQGDGFTKTTYTNSDGSTTEEKVYENGRREITMKDADGNLVREEVVDESGKRTVTEYHPDGTSTRTEGYVDSQGNGETTVTEFDEDGNPLSVETTTFTQTRGGKSTSVVRTDGDGNETYRSESTVDNEGNEEKEERAPDADSDGEIVTKTSTNKDGSGTREVSLVPPDPGAEPVILEQEVLTGGCSPEDRAVYQRLLQMSAGRTLSTMAGRVQMAQFLKNNREAIERLKTYGACGTVPNLSQPCPVGCSENSPVATRLREMVKTYEKSSDAAFRSTMLRSIQNFLEQPSNQADLNKYLACVNGINTIAESSPDGYVDPLIAQCRRFPSVDLPNGVDFTPERQVRTIERPKEDGRGTETITIETNPDGTETIYVGDPTNSGAINFQNADGTQGQKKKGTDEDGNPTITSSTRNPDGTTSVHVETYPPGTEFIGPNDEIIDFIPPDGVEPTSTQNYVIDKDNKNFSGTQTTRNQFGDVTVVEIEGSIVEKEDGSTESIITSQSQVTTRSEPCQACEGLNLDLVNGYYRWQQLFKRLHSGDIELQDGSKVQTPEALQESIRDSLRQMTDAEETLANTNLNDEQRAAAAADRQTAMNTLRDLQGDVDQSYHTTKKLYDDYAEWQRNLSTLPGGVDALNKIKECHRLVGANLCQSPFRCPEGEACVFGEDVLGGLNPQRALGAFDNIQPSVLGESTGPGGHYANGEPRKWVEDPAARRARLEAERNGTTTTPDNVSTSYASDGSRIIRVTEDNEVSTTYEHPDGSLTIVEDQLDDEGNLVERNQKNADGSRVETSVERTEGGPVVIEVNEISPQGVGQLVYMKEEKPDGSFEEQRPNANGELKPVKQGVREVYEYAPDVIKPDGGLLVTEFDPNTNEIIASYTSKKLNNGQEIRLNPPVVIPPRGLTAEDYEYYTNQGHQTAQDEGGSYVNVDGRKYYYSSETGKIDRILEPNGNVTLAPRVGVEPCTEVPGSGYYQTPVAQVIGSRRRQFDRDHEQENEQRAANKQAVLNPTYYRDENGKQYPTPPEGIDVTPVDADYLKFSQEATRVEGLLSQYHQLLTELSEATSSSRRGPAEIISEIENLLDQYGDDAFENFPSLRQMVREAERQFNRSDCAEGQYLTAEGRVSVTRGVVSQVDPVTSVFVPVDVNGSVIGSFSGPSTPTSSAQQAILLPNISNPCVYPGAQAAQGKRQEVIDALVAQAGEGANAAEITEKVDNFYSLWEGASQIEELGDFATDYLKGFQDARIQDPSVWSQILQSHGIECNDAGFGSKVGTIGLGRGAADTTTSSTGPSTPSTGRVSISKLETVTDAQPCSLARTLENVQRLLNLPPGTNTPEINEALKKALPGLVQAVGMLEGISAEQNRTALDARIQQYFEFLALNPEVLSVISGLNKADIDAGKCSVFVVSNSAFGTQKAEVKITAPPQPGTEVEVVRDGLDVEDPCLKQLRSIDGTEVIYGGFADARDALDTSEWSDSDLEKLDRRAWAEIEDPAFQEIYQEYLQLEQAFENYLRLRRELTQIDPTTNSTAFDDVLRRMQDLFSRYRQTEHFNKPFLEMIQDIETSALGDGCAPRGSSYFKTRRGPIQVNWPSDLLDATRACIDQVKNRDQLLQYLRNFKQSLENDESVEFSQTVFKRVLKQMLDSGEITQETYNEISPEFTGEPVSSVQQATP